MRDWRIDDVYSEPDLSEHSETVVFIILAHFIVFLLSQILSIDLQVPDDLQCLTIFIRLSIIIKSLLFKILSVVEQIEEPVEVSLNEEVVHEQSEQSRVLLDSLGFLQPSIEWILNEVYVYFLSNTITWRFDLTF